MNWENKENDRKYHKLTIILRLKKLEKSITKLVFMTKKSDEKMSDREEDGWIGRSHRWSMLVIFGRLLSNSLDRWQS